MKIGIITAMPEETGAIVRAAGQARKSHLGALAAFHAQAGGHELVIVEGGMGFANGTAAARQLVTEQHPDLLVSAGFCGGITDGLRVGDAVLAAGLMIVSATGLQEVHFSSPAVCRDLVPGKAGDGRILCAGTFLTTRAIMQKSRLAALLPPDTACPVVEMESAAIAQVAGEHDIPFVGLRTVSDPFDEELGFSLDEFCDGQLRIRIPRVLLTIARKPRIIPQLVRLARNSRVAADSLSVIIPRLLAVL